MKEIFGDTAAYYCSENNPKYGKMFNKLTECVKDRELQKRYLFTTKAFGIGTEIKDRTVKHLYIDQWKPTDIFSQQVESAHLMSMIPARSIFVTMMRTGIMVT